MQLAERARRPRAGDDQQFGVLSAGVPAGVLGCKRQTVTVAASGRRGADWKVAGRAQRTEDGWTPGRVKFRQGSGDLQALTRA